MKFASVLLVAAHLAMVQSSVVDLKAAECGELGVFNVNPADLPAGVTMSDVRACREHPESTSPSKKRDDGAALFKRDCNKGGKKRGCSKNGYCWKECGNKQSSGHEWCWGAVAQGWGPWLRCGVDADCGSFDCAAGDCKDCGCSC